MPFAMSPDSGFLYESAQHSAALTMLEFAMESQAPFCLLTGEIGSGKTTLIRRLLRMVSDKQMTVGLVSHSHGRFKSIHPWALSALGIVDDDESEIGQFEALNDFFIREYGRGRRTLLIFDEAQNLSIRTLEELRLLSNVNSEKDVALQIMLVGQPELRSKLQRPELRQFAQRISIDFHLNSLTLPETEAYIRHRLTVAGSGEAIFEREAVELIHQRSGGIPRVVNQLCDLCLVYAYAERARQVSASIAAEVLRDKSRHYALQPPAMPRTNGAVAPSPEPARVEPVAPLEPPRVEPVAPMPTAMAPPVQPAVAAPQAAMAAEPPMAESVPALEEPAPVALQELPVEAPDETPPEAPLELPAAQVGRRRPRVNGARPAKVGYIPLNIGVQPEMPANAAPKKRAKSWFFFS